jgi:hypothetical protein
MQATDEEDRIEHDLIDQFFNCSEKRLARRLLRFRSSK